MSMIKNKDMVNSYGLIIGSMKVNGLMENSMEEAIIQTLRE